jgi:hypothetical protein
MEVIIGLAVIVFWGWVIIKLYHAEMRMIERYKARKAAGTTAQNTTKKKTVRKKKNTPDSDASGAGRD